MKELKDHLRSLKTDYHSIQYPGNLADEVSLNPGWGWKIGGAMAIAAVLAVGVVMWIATGGDQATREVAKAPTAQSPQTTTGTTPEEAWPEDEIATVIAPTDITQSVPTWSSITTTPVTTPSIAAPSFPEVQSASMPYGSLSMPTMSEINKSLQQQQETTGNEQT